jgi:hypothetical protein
VKYTIDEDEVWPQYSPIPADGDPPGAVEIHDAFMERYRKAADEWSTVQAVLGRHAERSEKQYAEWREDPAHTCAKTYRPSSYPWEKRRCYAVLVDGKCPYDTNGMGRHP